MEVKPGIGIGLVKFGMNKEEVESLFGKPNEVSIDEEDDNKEIWTFNDKKMRLSFYADEGYRLGYIESSNLALEINGKKLLGKKIDAVKKEFLNQKIKDWEHEKYPFFSICFNEDYYISLHESYGEITEVSIGVPFKNDDEFQWP